MKSFKILVTLFLLFTGLYAEKQVISIKNADQKAYNWVKKNHIEIYMSFKSGQLDIFIDENKTDFLDQNNYIYEIITTESQMLRDVDDGYHTLAEVEAELDSLAAAYPSITNLFSLGKSTCGLYYQNGNDNYSEFDHDIWCIKLSDNPDIEEDEPNIFLGGTIHSREIVSLEIELNILNYLLSNYETDPQVKGWIDSTQIWVVPLMNPDGYKVVREDLHLNHRKNMRDNNNNDQPDYSTTDGTDLNRNFGYVWGNNGTSNYPSSNIYHGPAAWSEIESTYYRDLINSRRFLGAITYHSYAEKILYPLGHLPGVCSYDHQVMQALASEMAAVTPRLSGGNYGAIQAVDFGYTCQGTMGDWGYSEERVFSFTIEVGTTFIQPYNQGMQIVDDNLAGALIFLDRPQQSILTGHVKDSLGTPLVAEMYVSGIDDASGMTEVEPYRSGPIFGRFDRALLPGSYDVVFHCSGFADAVYENIVITADHKTHLEVTMTIGSEFVEEVNISLVNDEVVLNWTAEEGFGYQILSSDFSEGEYDVDTSGEFTATNTWKTSPLLRKKFYKVRRVLSN